MNSDSSERARGGVRVSPDLERFLQETSNRFGLAMRRYTQLTAALQPSDDYIKERDALVQSIIRKLGIEDDLARLAELEASEAARVKELVKQTTKERKDAARMA